MINGVLFTDPLEGCVIGDSLTDTINGVLFTDPLEGCVIGDSLTDMINGVLCSLSPQIAFISSSLLQNWYLMSGRFSW